MIIPVRCFTCGKPIGHLWEEFKVKVAEGTSDKAALDELGLEKFCCRKAILGQADNIELTTKFKKA
jgi:DNA-directed RNA polymerase subunit N (RpoN/RPB10)